MKFRSPSRGFLFIPVASFVCISGILEGGTVTTIADSGAGSLRAAVAAAVNGEIIGFSPALDGATISLTTGPIVLAGLEVTIDGSALPSGIILGGSGTSRILTVYSNSNLTLKKLAFRNGREQAGSGGALYIQGGSFTMTDCSVAGCYAASDGGGAVMGNGVVVIIDRCSFVGNEGADYGGALYLFGAASVTITNTVFSGNRSLNGGGILNLSDNPVIKNCTIQGNAGEGIRNENASMPILRNTIVWGNRGGGGSIAAQQIKNNGPGSSTAVDYSLIEGAVSTLNNLDGTLPASDPRFILPVVAASAPTDAGDLRVFTNSPVLDHGDNSSNSTAFDRAGRDRVQNGTIDLGAFESGYVTFAFLYPTLPTAGDANGNGVSNLEEYALGRDPSAPGYPTALPRISQVGPDKFLKFTQRLNAADIATTWQTSVDLSPLSWQPMQVDVDYTINSTTTLLPGQTESVLKLTDPAPAKFYRQRFSLP